MTTSFSEMTDVWCSQQQKKTQEVTTAKKKKKRAVAPPPRLLGSLGENSVGYSTEALAALREAQPIKVEFKPRDALLSLKEHASPAIIPDEREISMAKASREAKRFRLSSSAASAQDATHALEKDYMALDVVDQKKVLVNGLCKDLC